MGVDHNINIGYGFRLKEADLKITDPENDTPEEILDRVFWGKNSNYSLLTYFPGGSYYGGDPIEYAIVFESTHQRATDLTGFLDVERPSLTLDGIRQMWAVVEELTGIGQVSWDQKYAWQIAGLWS